MRVLPHDQCCCCCTGTGCSLTGIASTSWTGTSAWRPQRRTGVIEAVLGEEASGGGDGAYANFFHACTGEVEVEPLANHARASVRGPARSEEEALRAQPKPDVVVARSSEGRVGPNFMLLPKIRSVDSIPLILSYRALLFPSQPPAGATAPPGVPGSAFGFMNAAGPTSPPKAPATPASPSPKSFDPLLRMGMPGSDDDAAADANVVPAVSSPNPNASHQMAQMAQMQLAYQQNMMMMQQQMAQMQMYQRRGSVVGSMGMQRQGSIGAGGGGGGGMGGGGGAVPPPLPVPGKQPIMGANYMRQVPVVSGGDGSRSSFSFLGDPSKKQDNHSFDFVKDAMKNEK